MQLKTQRGNIFYVLFSLLLTGLPFSKALSSIAFVGLLLFSIFFIKGNNAKIETKRLVLLPTLIYAALTISLLYTENINGGFKILLSQIDFIAIPFIFFINQDLIQKRLNFYLKVFISATAVAAFITFIFFLLPSPIVQNIATVVSLLKDYIVHDKAYAFGVYSPFTERLQFSYILGIAFFLQLYLVVKAKNVSIFQWSKSFFFMILFFSTLLILGARGAQLAFIMGALIWVITLYFYYIHPKIIQKSTTISSFGLFGCSVLLLFIVLPYFMYQKIPAVKTRYDQLRWELGTFQDGTFKNYEYTHFTSIRRLLSWKNNWSIIKQNPVLGVGIGDYQAAMALEYEKDDLDFPVNTQSQFLYYWTATGLLGLLALLLLLFYPIFSVLKTENNFQKVLMISFLCFYSVVFLFDAPLNFQVGSMSFLVFYCLGVFSITR